MGMFNKQIKFYGKHADILQKYSKDKGSEQNVSFYVDDNSGHQKNIYLFETRINCYMVAAMLGILYQRTAEIDKSTPTTASIFNDALNNNYSNLQRIYQHMVLSDTSIPETDAKIKKAFSVMDDETALIEQNKLENYVRGGLEIIDEYFQNCSTYEDVCNSVIDLLTKLPSNI